MSGVVTMFMLALGGARLAATLAFVLPAVVASAQTQSFEGRVVDPQGAAISGARITLSDTAGRCRSASIWRRYEPAATLGTLKVPSEPVSARASSRQLSR